MPIVGGDVLHLMVCYMDSVCIVMSAKIDLAFLLVWATSTTYAVTYVCMKKKGFPQELGKLLFSSFYLGLELFDLGLKFGFC